MLNFVKSYKERSRLMWSLPVRESQGLLRWVAIALIQLAFVAAFIWIAPLLWHVLALGTILGLVKEFVSDHPVFSVIAGIYIGGALVMLVVFLNFMDGHSRR